MGTIHMVYFKNCLLIRYVLDHYPHESVMVAGGWWLKHNGPALWGGCDAVFAIRHKFFGQYTFRAEPRSSVAEAGVQG